jgi:polyhydroxybutyrate depolymerase
MRGRKFVLGLGWAPLCVACGSASKDAANPRDASSDAKVIEEASFDAGHEAGLRDASRAEVSVMADSSADAETPPGDASRCGTRTGMRGLTMRSVAVGSTTRTYLAYLPMSLSATAPVPFVYVFHGFTESGEYMYENTGYAALADSEGFAVVFPDGEGGPDSDLPPWNIENPGQTVCGNGQFEVAKGDDFGFMDAMRADVEQDQCIDGTHVFSAGFSMGGYFTHHVGCYRSDIRAVAPHSGGTLADLSVCPTGHVPTIIFHGTLDLVIADACDDPKANPFPKFPPSALLWAAKNGCQSTYSTIPETGAGGASGQCYLFDGCPTDGQVEVCTFNGMPHCWAGGNDPGTGGLYSCTDYPSATQLQWSFFKAYAW